MSDSPARPRLGEHVLARRHLVDGQERVVLHDTRSGRSLALGPREWGLVAVADGTRDLEGIRLAGAREGAHARTAAIAEFFEALHAAGLLAEAASEASEDREDEGDEGAARRPVAELPDFSLHCDGSGSCCRLYASVLFGPVEAARARALLPLVQSGGERHDRAFLPERGSAPSAASAVTLVDGRCAYLGEGGRCGLHAVGGPEQKPLGCRLFPARFVDDGEEIRVSASVECACVEASVGRPGGASLCAPEWRARGDLPESVFVERLPPRMAVSKGAAASRGELVAWSRRLSALTQPADVAAALWSLGEAVEARGLEGAALAAFERPSPLEATALAPWLAALAGRAARRGREYASWRSERDLARRAVAWIEAALGRLEGEPGALAALSAAPAQTSTRHAVEAFYLRAVLHGHQLFGELPLSYALRDRALRIIVSRALPAAVAATGDDDPAGKAPLSLVEAVLRGHGLDAYAFDV